MIVANSARVIVAATADKLGTQGNHQVAELAQIDDLVVTADGSDAQLRGFRDAGIRIQRVPAAPAARSR
ncbi:hypothetical protein [Xanthomonas maliensis]|uniref:hypothetical protein n=1 Tax=Xanthomonas maliensis TaxID=1321368 RepID=UPI00039E48AC|nr:hypothetical protein [Xanthomonas maliensis]KAB7770174.1 hypothetical protein CKY51_05360 [Xanthomonas maliensis]